MWRFVRPQLESEKDLRDAEQPAQLAVHQRIAGEVATGKVPALMADLRALLEAAAGTDAI